MGCRDGIAFAEEVVRPSRHGPRHAPWIEELALFASVRRLRLVVVVCTRVRRWGSRSVRCCMRARIREARSAGRVCGSCILYGTCVAAAPVFFPLFPLPPFLSVSISIFFFRSSFFLVEFS